MRSKFGLPATVASLVALLVFGWVSPAALGAVEFQLVILLDGSSSIRLSDFNLEKDGIADALDDPGRVPTDGTVELTLIQFGYGTNGEARVEISPTVIHSSETLQQFVQKLQRVRQAHGRTNIEAALDLAMRTLKSSPNFSKNAKQTINIATDGKPNRPVGEKTGRQRALQARDRAVAAGLDELAAEAIGQALVGPIDPDSLIAFLLELAYPQPSVLIEDFQNPPNREGKGFVIRVADFAALKAAYELKLGEVFGLIANAGGPYFCQPGQRIRLDGSGSRATGQGKIASYEWDLDGDSQFDDATGVRPDFTCGENDVIVALKVTNDRGKTAVDTAEITIGFPPVIDIGGPYSCKEKRTITLDASGSSDPDGSIVSFEWDFNGDGQTDATGTTVQFTCPAVEQDSGVKVTLTVTDNEGLKVKKSTTVSVTANLVPVADAGPNPNGNPNDSAYTCDPGQTITLDGSGSFDPDGTIVKYEWDLDGDKDFNDATGPTTSFVCPGVSGLAITDLIALRVIDDDDATTTDGGVLVVTKSCPVEGKPTELFKTLEGLGHEYKDYIIFVLRNQLVAAHEAADSISVDPTEDDLSDVEDELRDLYPVMDSVESLFKLITAFSTDLQCRVNALKTNLNNRMDEGKFDQTFGKRIIRDLDALLDIFKRVDEVMPTVVGAVDAADAALSRAIVAAEDQDPESTEEAVTQATKQLLNAVNIVDRVRRKHMSAMLNRFKSIQRVLDVAKRKGQGVSEPGVVLGIESALGKTIFIAEGTNVAKIDVKIFALNGAKVFAQAATGSQLIFDSQTLSNGVYLTVITALDAQGKPLESRVNKLVVRR